MKYVVCGIRGLFKCCRLGHVSLIVLNDRTECSLLAVLPGLGVAVGGAVVVGGGCSSVLLAFFSTSPWWSVSGWDKC